MGNSSINRIIISPDNFIGFNLEYFAWISPVGSVPFSDLFRILMSPPISIKTSRIPVRNEFRPTFFIIISESFFINAATIKNAALDKSPGMLIFLDKLFHSLLQLSCW